MKTQLAGTIHCTYCISAIISFSQILALKSELEATKSKCIETVEKLTERNRQYQKLQVKSEPNVGGFSFPPPPPPPPAFGFRVCTRQYEGILHKSSHSPHSSSIFFFIFLTQVVMDPLPMYFLPVLLTPQTQHHYFNI